MIGRKYDSGVILVIWGKTFGTISKNEYIIIFYVKKKKKMERKTGIVIYWKCDIEGYGAKPINIISTMFGNTDLIKCISLILSWGSSLRNVDTTNCSERLSMRYPLIKEHAEFDFSPVVYNSRRLIYPLLLQVRWMTLYLSPLIFFFIPSQPYLLQYIVFNQTVGRKRELVRRKSRCKILKLS